MTKNRRALSQGLCIVMFIFFMTFLGHITNNTFNSQSGGKSSEALKQEIRQLSVEYVRQLMRENSEGEDLKIGPKESSNIDMSKSMAVVLSGLLEKIARIEKQLEAVNNCTKKKYTQDDNNGKIEDGI